MSERVGKNMRKERGLNFVFSQEKRKERKIFCKNGNEDVNLPLSPPFSVYAHACIGMRKRRIKVEEKQGREGKIVAFSIVKIKSKYIYLPTYLTHLHQNLFNSKTYLTYLVE